MRWSSSRSKASALRSEGRFDVPGKVFLLGEYAVLEGGPAVVAALAPRFSARVLESGDSPSPFHPESPAGRLDGWVRSGVRYIPWRLELSDPWNGRGGFGGSSAEYLLLYRAYGQELGWDLSWQAAWRLYRDLMAESGPVAIGPSGADVVAQWQGGVTLFRPSSPSAENIATEEALGSLIVFAATDQAGRKEPTHAHLADLERRGGLPDGLVASLSRVSESGAAALRAGDSAALGAELDRYGDLLADAGLECAATRGDRLALRGLPGVLGIKGAGALQADALVAVFDPNAPDEARAAFVRAAEARGLRLAADGLEPQKGIS